MKNRSFFGIARPDKQTTESTEDREFVAEQLEARVLYSAAPLDVEGATAATELVEVDQTQSSTFSSLDEMVEEQVAAPAGESQINEVVHLTSFENLSQTEIETITAAAIERWKSTDLNEAQLEALEAIEISIIDIEGLALAETNGYQIDVDIDAAGQGWFIDETPFTDDEFDYGVSTTILRDTDGDAQYGMDLLSVMMHEVGHVLGMEDVYAAAERGSIMYGGFTEGERRVLVSGQADGAEAGTVFGANATIVVDQAGDDAAAEAAGTTLREAIIAAVAGDTIVLSANTTYTLSQGELAVDKDLIFQGADKNTTIIDANASASDLRRVMNITGTANVTLQNLTITGGYIQDARGGGISHSGGTLTLTSVLVTGNTVDDFSTADHALGGGIYNNNRTIVATDSDLTGNQAIRTSGDDTAAGGGIFSNGSAASTTWTGGTIANNVSREGGGAYIWSAGGEMDFAGVTFDSNQATAGQGGGIRTAVGVSVDITANGATNSAFTNNTGSGGGGAIANDGALTVIGAGAGSEIILENNSSGTSDGGAIRNRLEASLTITDAILRNNTADDGAGIFSESGGTTITGTRVTIEDNVATRGGGGIYNANEGVIMNLTDSVIQRNTANNFYGGGVYNQGTLSLVNTDIEDNQALDLDNTNRRDGHGGGFFNGEGGILNMDANSDVRGNSNYGQGAGGFNQGGTINANGNTWENNFTIYNNSDRHGGGLWNYLAGVANLDGVTFQNNEVSRQGGTFADGTGTLQGHGGAIFNSTQAILNITGASTFTNNRAETGGAISTSDNGTVTNITGTAGQAVVINGNFARDGGGGINNNSETSRYNLSYVTISNNIALDGDGGGYRGGSGILRGDHVTITNNAAGSGDDDDGGGMFVSGRSDILLTDSVVSDNTAFDRGGGVFIQSESIQVRFENSVISGNKSGIDKTTATGYAVDQTTGTYTVGDLTTATTNANGGAEGGGFYLRERAQLDLINSSVINNVSRDDGGAIRSNDDSRINIVGSFIDGNLAGYNADGSAATVNSHGGAINALGRTQLTIKDSVISNNEARQYGGALMLQGETVLRMSGTTVANNVALDHGGGVNSWDTNVRSYVTNSTFAGNYTGYTRVLGGDATPDYVQTRNGGGWYNRRGISELTHVTLSENVANNGGGLRVDNNGNSHVVVTNTVAVGNLRGNTQTPTAARNTSIAAADDLTNIDSIIPGNSDPANTALLPLSNAFQVGASNAGSGGAITSTAFAQVYIPDAASTALIDAATTTPLASDQTGGGRAAGAAADIGAVETNALTTSLVLDALNVPTVAVSGVAIDLDAIANSTGAGPVNFSWTVNDGTTDIFTATNPVGVSLTEDEINAVQFSHLLTDVETASQTLTVTLTVTDTTTGQAVTETATITLYNPDACPTTPSAAFTVTNTNDGGAGSLRQAIDDANASGAGDVVITFDASINGSQILTALAGNNEHANANGDYDITKTNGAVFFVGNGAANTIINGGGIDRVFEVRPNATVYFKDLTITGGATTSTADDHGGGIKIQGGRAFFHNTEIVGNVANAETGHVGGGIYATSNGLNGAVVSITGDSLVSGNSAASHGGGIYFSGTLASSSILNIDGTAATGSLDVSGNRASQSLNDRDGGGIYITGQSNVALIKNTNITDNWAKDDGGGFFIAGSYNDVTFDNVTVSRNVVDNHEGANNGGSAPALDSTTLSSAGIAILPSNNFANVSFNSGATDSDGGGGLIIGTDNTVNFIGGTFGGDRASGTDEIQDGNYAEGDGGALSIQGDVTVTFDGTTIRGNVTTDSGAGLDVVGAAVVTFDNGSMTENYTVGEHGGAVRVDAGTFHSTNSTFSNNRAGDRVYASDPNNTVGGGFYVTSGGSANLVDTTITNNQAEGRGGGIFVNRGEVNISSSTEGTKTSSVSSNVTIETNDDNRGGAAIYMTGAGSVLNATDTIFSDNRSARSGGAIFLQSAAIASLERVDVSANEAANEGGGIYVQGDQSRLNLQDVNITGNASRNAQGGGLRTNGVVTGDSVVFSGNRTNYDLDTAAPVNNTSQDRQGGAIYIGGAEASVTLSNAILYDNHTYGSGGGVRVNDGALTLTNFIIRGNTTDSNNNEGRGRGGGIYGSDRATINLTNGEISDNTAEGHGGGVHIRSDLSVFNATNVTFSGNKAGIDGATGTYTGVGDRVGGGFYQTNIVTSVMDHVTVANNEVNEDANSAGAGVRRDGGTLTLRNSIVMGNNRDVDATSSRRDVHGFTEVEGQTIIDVTNTTPTATNGFRVNPDDPSVIGDPQSVFVEDTATGLKANGGPVALDALAATLGIDGMRTHAIDAAGLAADAAIGSSLTTDQRGVARQAQDIGAYEVGVEATGYVTDDDTFTVHENCDLTVTAGEGVLSNDLEEQLPAAVVNYDASGAGASTSSWVPQNPDGSLNSADTDQTFVVGGGVSLVGEVNSALPGITAAYRFDGSAGINNGGLDGLDTGNPSAVDSTIELWIRPDSNTTAYRVYETGGSGTGAVVWLDATGKVNFTVDNGTTPANAVTITSTSTISTTEFTQIVAVYNVNATNNNVDIFELYINGVLEASDSSNTGINQWIGTDGGSIGGVSGSTGEDPNTSAQVGAATVNFSGDVAAFRFYERALSQGAVTQAYDVITKGETAEGNAPEIVVDDDNLNGTVSVNADGSFTYTAAAGNDPLATGETAVDSFVYYVDDGRGSVLEAEGGHILSRPDTLTANFGVGQTESDSTVTVATEQFAVKLGAALNVDVASPTAVTIDASSTITAGTIAANTVVNSHLIHFDQASTSEEVNTLVATIRFDSPILGLIWTDANLDASDTVVGNAAGYATGVVGRGSLDAGENEQFTISADGMTLTVRLDQSTTDIDQLRVITAPLSGESATATITIVGTNDEVAAADDAYSMNATDTSLAGSNNVITTGGGIDTDTDINGSGADDTLIVVAVNDNTANVGIATGTTGGTGAGVAQVTIDSTGAIAADANSDFSYLTSGQSSAETVTYTVADQNALTVGLETHLAFGEASTALSQTANDLSGNGRSGTLNGDAAVVASDSPVGGEMLSLDGAGDFVRIQGYQGVTGSDARTVSAWIKTTGTNETIVSWGNNNVNEKIVFRVQEEGAPRVPGAIRIETNGGNIVGTTVVNDGNWHHVAFTFDGANLGDVSLYVDGQLETLSATSTGAITTAADQDVFIGRDFGNASAVRDFTGNIDDFGMWSRALSAEEIAQIYNAADCDGHSFQEHDHATVTVTIQGEDPVNVAPTATTVILDSADGSGMNPRFGLTEAVVTNPLPGETDSVTQIGGDATASFSDLYGSSFNSLASLNLAPGDDISFSAELLSSLNPGATGANLLIRFYSDVDDSGTLEFGAGSEFANRVEVTSSGADLSNTTSFQLLSLNTTIPTVDGAGNPITHFEYAISLPQSGEDADQAVNSVVAPYELYVRNISLGGIDQTVTYTEDDASVAIEDYVIRDADGPTEIVTATLTLADTSTGSLTTGTFGGVTSTYDSGTGIWTATGLVADVNAALADVAFIPTANNDVDTTVSLVVEDGDEESSTPITQTITLDVTAINDDPVNDGTLPGTVSADENVAEAISFAAIDLSDIDAGTGDLDLKFTVSGGVLSATAANGVTVAGDGTAALTLTGTLAELNAFLDANNITYTGNVGVSGTAADSIVVAVNDKGNTGDGGGLDVALGSVQIDIDAAFAANASLSVTTQGVEGSTNIVYTVTLDAINDTGAAITFDLSDDGTGTALSGSDYAAIVGAQISVANGQTTGTYTVTVTDDSLVEATETVAASISNPSDANVTITTASATANITDNDQPAISINDVTVNEGAGTMTFQVTLDQAPATGQSVTVNYAAASGTATLGTDFTLADGTVTFAAGETSKDVVVTVTNDTVYEGSETFTVGLSGATGATIADASGIGTILDDGTGTGGTDDDTPTLSIADVSVTEGADTHAVFTLTLSNASNEAVVVTPSLAGVTATLGSDFGSTLEYFDGSAWQPVTGNVTIAAGETSLQVRTAVVDDFLADDGETFTLTATHVSGALAGSPVAITNASFETPLVNNANGFTVASTGSTSLTGWNVSGTSAFVMDDTFDNFDNFSNTSAASDGEQFVQLQNGTNDTTISQNITTVPGQIYELAFDYGGLGFDNRQVTLTYAVGGVSQTIDYNLDNLSAQTNTWATQTYRFTATGTSTEISFTGDGFAGLWGVGVDNVRVSQVSVHSTATISDDTDTALVSIAGPGSVAEGANTGNYTVTVDQTPVADITVNLTYTGTATDGSDFSGVASVTISANTTSTTFTLPTIDDSLVEVAETIIVSLGTISGGGFEAIAADGSNNSVTTTITDNDQPAISINDVTVNEGAGTMTFQITLDQAPVTGQSVSVNYAAASGTATLGTDFTLANGSVTFAAGETSKDVVVTVTNDTVYEGSESFTIGLSGATGGTIAGGSGTGTILDDGTGVGGTDNDTPTLTIADVSVTEGTDSHAVFTLTLSNASDEAVVLTPALAGGTATAGTDFGNALEYFDGSAWQPVTGNVTIAAGQTTVQVRTTVVDDFLADDGETFTLTAAHVSGAVTSTADVVSTATISDDADTALVSISGPGSVTEGDATGNYTVTVDQTPATDITVNLAYTGTAADGSDYTGVASVTISAGTTSQTFTINTIDDALVEVAENIVVTIDSVSGGGFEAVGIGSSNTVTTTIIDNEVVAAYYVDDAWVGTANNTVFTDADLGETGDQGGIFNQSAFATIQDAITAAQNDGINKIIINGGNYTGPVTIPAGMTVDITGPDVAQTVTVTELSSAAGSTLVLEGGSTLTVNNGSAAALAGDIIGTGNLVKSGSGTLTVSGNNTFSGGSTISEGTLQLDHGNGLGTGSILVDNVNSSARLTLNGVTVDEPITINGNGGGPTKLSSIGTSTINGVVTLNSTSRISGGTLIFSDQVNSTANQVLVSNAVFNDVVDLGTATMIQHVSQATYNAAGNNWGNLHLAFGAKATLGANDALPTDQEVTFGWGSNIGWNNSTLDLNGFDQTVSSILTTGGAVDVGGSMNITDSSGNGTLTVDQDSDTVYQGSLTGGVTLVKEGSGRLTLENISPSQHSDSVDIVINDGALKFLADSSAQPIIGNRIEEIPEDITVNGALLEFEDTNPADNRMAFQSDNITFGPSGGGTVDFISGNFLFQGTAFGTNDTFTTTGGAQNVIRSSGSAFLNAQGGNTITFNVADGTDPSGVDLVLSLNFLSGHLEKTGAGTMELTGSHTFAGDTSVNAGTLLVTGTKSGAGAVTVVSGATLAGTGSVAGAVTINAGGNLAPGNGGVGTLTLNGGADIDGEFEVELDGTGAGTADLAAINGNLDITNATLNLAEIVAVDDPQYVIATYTGTLTGSAFAGVTGLPAGYEVVIDTANKQILIDREDAPVITQGAGPITVNMTEDSSPIAFSVSVGATDADLGESATLSWAISSAASNGTANVTGIGGTPTVTYTPTANFNGTDSFTVEVTDADGLKDTIVINVNVAAVNDEPSVTHQGNQTVGEDAGAQTVTGFITQANPNGSLPGDSSEAGQTITYTLDTGSSTNLSLFSVAPAIDSSGNLTFTGAPNANGTATIVMTVTDDGGTANSGDDTTTITFDIVLTPLVDATVTLAANDPSATEGGDGGQFTVTMTEASDVDTTFTYSIGGTATGGTDYTTLSGTVTVLAGQTTATIDVSTINDGTVEVSETVDLQLTAVTAGNTGGRSVTIDTGNDSATVNILDDDSATVSIAAVTQAGEPNTNGQFQITLDGGATTPVATVINFTVSGTATNGTDFTVPGSVTIPANGNGGVVNVTALDDFLVEGTETVILTITSTDNSAVGVSTTSASASINLVDDEAATVSITAGGDATEGGAPGQFTISLPTGVTSATDTVVTFAVSGTVDGSDHTLPFTVTIPAGLNSVDIDVNALPDNLIEGNETMTVTLTAVDNPLIAIDAVDTASIEIIDATDNTATISALSTNPSESGGSGQFLVSFGDGITATVDTTFTYNVTGTATDGTDFTIPVTTTIVAGQTTAFIDISILDDDLVEDPESIIVQLTGSDNPAVTVDTRAAEMQIASDDVADQGVPLQGILSVFRSLEDERMFTGFRADFDVVPGDRLPGEPLLTLTPFFAGVASPGATVRVVLTDEVGNEIGSQTVSADLAGNWSAALSGATVGDTSYTVRVEQTPVSWAEVGGLPMRSITGTFSGGVFGEIGTFGELRAGQIFGQIIQGVTIEEFITELISQ